jgi:inner membrane protein
MNGATHLIGGVTAGVVLGYTAPLELAVISVSSLVPDIDRKNSLLGRFIPILPHVLEGIGKRTITHSIVFGAVIAGLLHMAAPGMVLPFLVGYGSHLLFDVFTGRIALFWPLPWKIGVPLFGIPPVFVEAGASVLFGVWLVLGGYQHFLKLF